MKRILPLLFLLIAMLGACNSGAERDPSTTDDHDAANLPAPPPPIDTSLFDSLRIIENRSGGKIGLAAIDLRSGWRTVWRGDETFPLASVAKLPMAIAFLRLVDSGKIRLDSAIELHPTDHRPGGSIIFRTMMRERRPVRLMELLTAMVASSDNSACDILTRMAGGPNAVNALLRTHGFTHIDVSHYEGELILLWAGVRDLPPSDSAWTRDRFYQRIAEAGDTAWQAAERSLVDDPQDASAPEEMARLLVMLKHGELLSPSSTRLLLDIMAGATTGKARIPALLPAGTRVEHKTGTISSTTNDVGIVALPNGSGDLAIAIFVKGSRSSVRVRERAIADAARLVVAHVGRR